MLLFNHALEIDSLKQLFSSKQKQSYVKQGVIIRQELYRFERFNWLKG